MVVDVFEFVRFTTYSISIPLWSIGGRASQETEAEVLEIVVKVRIVGASGTG